MPPHHDAFLASIPTPDVAKANGSYSQMPGMLGNDLFWVIVPGLALFLVLAGAVWLQHRRKLGTHGKRGQGRRRRRRSHRPATLAETGGLPPPKTSD